MLSRLHSMALAGIEALRCEVEVDVASRGFDKALIVGLPDTAAKESLERVRQALRNSGYEWPKHKAVFSQCMRTLSGTISHSTPKYPPYD